MKGLELARLNDELLLRNDKEFYAMGRPFFACATNQIPPPLQCHVVELS